MLQQLHLKKQNNNNINLNTVKEICFIFIPYLDVQGVLDDQGVQGLHDIL